MNDMRLWAAALCSSAIIAAVIEGLLPEKTASRAAKLALSLWFTLIVLSPLARLPNLAGELPLELETPAVDAVGAQYADELLCEETERLLIIELTERLESAGVRPLRVETGVNISSQGGIYCDSVYIELGAIDADKKTLVSEISAEVTGKAPEIR